MNPICLLKSRKEKIFQGRKILKMVLKGRDRKKFENPCLTPNTV
jgi:hypothetical protein